MSPPPPRLSIVMPVLDEAATIQATLAALAPLRARGAECEKQHAAEQSKAPLRARGAELIVVAGGSTDATCALAAPLADGLLAAARGRARQMNAGAARAQGDVLLFLHADTLLPPGADGLVQQALAAGAGWGRFDVRISGRPWLLRLVAALMNQRSRCTGIATGDPAMVVRREWFVQVGGFPDQPLMEDIALSRRLRSVARPAGLRARHHVGPALAVARRLAHDFSDVVAALALLARYAGRRAGAGLPMSGHGAAAGRPAVAGCTAAAGRHAAARRQAAAGRPAVAGRHAAAGRTAAAGRHAAARQRAAAGRVR